MPTHFTSSAYSRFVSVGYESPFFIKYFKALCTVSLVCVSTKWVLFFGILITVHRDTRVNQKVKTIFKLRGNRDREELAHCAVLTMPVEEISHVQYSALPSVKWQQRGRKHGRSFVRLHHRRTTWRSAVSLGRRSETCGNSPSYVGSVWTEHHESTKGL